LPGGPLASKPTWSNAFTAFHHVGFFCWWRRCGTAASGWGDQMLNTDSTVAHEIAQAASLFEHRRTGHAPKSVTVVLSADTLVVTLHEALSPAERALAKTAAGAAQVQEFHRQLFTDSSESLRQEIGRITGVDVREATAEVETSTGTVVHVFTTGTMVQVFLLARPLPAETWSGSAPEIIHE
jgi:uncharacterized protein YbcI